MSNLLQRYREDALELLYQPPFHPSEVSFSQRSKSSFTTYINPSVLSQLHPAFPLYLIMSDPHTISCISTNIVKVAKLNTWTRKYPLLMRCPTFQDLVLEDQAVDRNRIRSPHRDQDLVPNPPRATSRYSEERRDVTKLRLRLRIWYSVRRLEMEQGDQETLKMSDGIRIQVK
jgi:hypothetical protein